MINKDNVEGKMKSKYKKTMKSIKNKMNKKLEVVKRFRAVYVVIVNLRNDTSHTKQNKQIICVTK